MRIKTISLVVALIGAVAVWTGGGFASGPTTLCPPINFQCALTVAQTKSLQDPNNPGQPSVLIGYLVTDSAGVPTIYVQQNKNGVLKTIQVQTGTCAGGTNGAPGVLNFVPGGGPKLDFVTFNNGNGLRFIDVATSGNIAAETLGSCTKL